MVIERLRDSKNFVEEDFLELKNSVEKLIEVIEKYKDMRYNSILYIDDLKVFLTDVNLILKEKKITDQELKNLNLLRESYFRTYGETLSEYYVYDKNNLEKTNQANDEIKASKERFGKILDKITEKVFYHIIE